MEVVKNLKSALAAINGTLTKLRGDLAEVNSRISCINGEVYELKRMPLCLDDWALQLRKDIDRQANGFIPNMRFMFNASYARGGLDCRENERPWSEQESSNDMLMFCLGLKTALKDDKALYFLFGDLIHEKLMQRIREVAGARWGNEELPRVAEREKRIAELLEERQGLEAKKKELEAEIDDISGSVAL